MEQNINDFNITLTNIVVAHKWFYNTSSIYECYNGRKTYGIIMLLSGNLNYQFSDGRLLTAKTGDLILLKQNDGYKVTCPNECYHYAVNFDILPNSIEGKIAEELFLNKETAVIHQDSSHSIFNDIFEQICNIWKQKKPCYQIQSKILTYKLLYNFVQKHPLYQDYNYSKLQPAIDFMKENWNKKISLSTLSKLCILSVPHFRHLFTTCFQTSPMVYLNSLRLLYAKDYLLRENLTITDVAYKCGFDDINYFSRFFKKHTGISPSEFRKL